MKKKGFTLIELLVVIAIIAMLLSILMPALNKVKKIAQRVVCGTNLKGLGNAQVVYANDFNGQYACQGNGAAHTWANETTGWQAPARNWTNTGNITVGASLYLLVRLADVSPKSFVCPSSDQQEFSGKNTNNYDIIDLWDFGIHSNASNFDSTTMDDAGPYKCVSYAYHQPYMGTSSTGQAGKFRADDQRSAAFAVMADRNPWYDPKLSSTALAQNAANLQETVLRLGAHWLDTWTGPTNGNRRQGIMAANAQPHEREGQNVLFADGHSSFEKESDAGVKNDNIYTPWMTPLGGPITWRSGYDGVTPNLQGADETPAGVDDSFLVNDIGTGSVR